MTTIKLSCWGCGVLCRWSNGSALIACGWSVTFFIWWIQGCFVVQIPALHNWMQCIFVLKGLFSEVTFQHIYREQSFEDNSLLKWALSLQPGFMHYEKVVDDTIHSQGSFVFFWVFSVSVGSHCPVFFALFVIFAQFLLGFFRALRWCAQGTTLSLFWPLFSSILSSIGRICSWTIFPHDALFG